MKKILMLNADDFCIDGMRDALEGSGAGVTLRKVTQDEILDPDCKPVKEWIAGSASEAGESSVFSFNFYPPVAIACHDAGVGYISWVYDNPCIHLYHYSVSFDTNEIYVFESDTAEYFNAHGIGNVHYLPMAADPERLEKVISGAAGGSGKGPGNAMGAAGAYSAPKDISFVGSLYDEEHDFWSGMIGKGISAHTEGYLRGIMEAQKRVYGCDLISASLTDEILEDMHRALPLEPDAGSIADSRYLFAKYVIDRRITAEERRDLLEKASDCGEVHIYTRNPKSSIKGCINHGPANSDTQAPLVYASSKINLNISLRSITHGIPLRAFEIMGSGGFLLTNYQADMERFFVAGEDYDYFESPEDMCEKIRYYLKNEDVRKRIAESGRAKVHAEHTFEKRVRDMCL